MIAPMKLSARNQLAGRVESVTPGAVTTTVKVRLTGGEVVTSSITREAGEELGLEPGVAVVVVIKASDVLLGTE